MITMKDVAKEAGVSRPTVSLVLNGRHAAVKISEATRTHVLATAKRLGFRRNQLATSIKTGTTNIIGFVGGMEGEYVLGILRGIAETLLARNYLLKTFPLSHGAPEPQTMENIARQCAEQRVAGAICRGLSERQLDVLHRELETARIPILLVDNSFPHDWCPRIVSDDRAGMGAAIRHLRTLGHSRIAYVTVPGDSGFMALRLEGYYEGMRACGLPVREDRVHRLDPVEGGIPRCGPRMDAFYRDHRPTALVCDSDPLAMAVLQWAHARKIDVPSRLSVVGFAGLAYSALASPALTTVAQPFIRMGERAAQVALDLIRGGERPADEWLPVELVVRDSTAAPPADSSGFPRP